MSPSWWSAENLLLSPIAGEGPARGERGTGSDAQPPSRGHEPPRVPPSEPVEAGALAARVEDNPWHPKPYQFGRDAALGWVVGLLAVSAVAAGGDEGALSLPDLAEY